MRNLKAAKRNILLTIAALLLISAGCTWAIAASSETAPAVAPGAAPELAFEDLPEFAPKFQQVVARKHFGQHRASSRFGESLVGVRLRANPALM
jgi:hypothetical protein